MAVELNNSIFIHTPKTGGKFVSNFLLKNFKEAKLIGEPVWDAHVRYSIKKKMTFGFIRHPVSFLESLWSHRKKKKNYDKNIFNWQDHLRLERECGSENFEEFILNVSKRKNIVWDFYMFYLGGHRNFTFCKFENLIDDLNIFLFKYENMDNFKNIDQFKIKDNDKRKKQRFSKELQKKILKSEEILNERFKYNYLLDL